MRKVIGGGLAVLTLGVGAIVAYGSKGRDPAAVVTPEPPKPLDGKALFLRYACASCHGPLGTGQYNLTKNRVNFPTDEALTAFIRDARAVKPGTIMPPYVQVIPPHELPVIVQYVRSLSAE